ncbi:protein-L-isoaspartate(D-aspartate) O-methyltransferase [Sphingobacteriales bacterium UPWRP_1]|nr:protein-L-isoaspartate O-methyltransferase [Sphingobacteriales bacterium TSM_CSM]PSJ72204.1 protein-L-isoaspartate(D-aspartate) O-methyltransferase [Sphingobacteriales bacterium UPWRP_1]
MLLEDNYKHIGMRRKLLRELAQEGITDRRVLDAMFVVPRHLFFEKAFVEKAYENNAFPIGEGQTISQPYTVAYQTQLLNVQATDKVLEIGTGSGYQACVLAEMGARVITIERNHKLFEKARQLIAQLGYQNITVVFGDGYEGAPVYAPFDKILVTAAAPQVPPKLFEQLKTGGVMVIPVGNDDSQNMLKITKLSETDYKEETGPMFKFVPMLKGKID